MSTTILLLIIIATVLTIAHFSYIRNSDRQLNSAPADENPDARAVIGESAYATMTSRVEQIMKRHRTDKCIAVNLTSGASSGDAADELHHLLPGDPLWLKPVSDDNLNEVAVYSGGYKIGSLMLLDADKALDIIASASITGTYVCEQNCYEYYDKVALRIIIFYTTSTVTIPADSPVPEIPVSADDLETAKCPVASPAPYKYTVRHGDLPFTFFQN